MTGDFTLYFIVLIALVVIALIVVWAYARRSQQNMSGWLIGLGLVVVVALALYLYSLAGGFGPSASQVQPPPTTGQETQPQPTKSPTETPPTPTVRPANKWQGIESIAAGLLPSCLRGAGLDSAWDYVRASDPAGGSLVVAFLLLTPATAARYKSACGDPAVALGLPKEGDYAYVALFAQALSPTQLELGRITFMQEVRGATKKFNIAEYLLDRDRLAPERWVHRTPAWMRAPKESTLYSENFPAYDYLRSDLSAGSKAIGLVALPTGELSEGQARLLDPAKAFHVFYEDASVVLSQP
jgi:hypothetical protein